MPASFKKIILDSEKMPASLLMRGWAFRLAWGLWSPRPNLLVITEMSDSFHKGADCWKLLRVAGIFLTGSFKSFQKGIFLKDAGITDYAMSAEALLDIKRVSYIVTRLYSICQVVYDDFHAPSKWTSCFNIHLPKISSRWKNIARGISFMTIAAKDAININY